MIKDGLRRIKGGLLRAWNDPKGTSLRALDTSLLAWREAPGLASAFVLTTGLAAYSCTENPVWEIKGLPVGITAQMGEPTRWHIKSSDEMVRTDVMDGGKYFTYDACFTTINLRDKTIEGFCMDEDKKPEPVGYHVFKEAEAIGCRIVSDFNTIKDDPLRLGRTYIFAKEDYIDPFAQRHCPKNAL